MNPELETQNSEPPVRVGDLIQYRYSYGPKGFTQWAITTREVIEVLNNGDAFVVEGGYYVPAKCVTVHIPMHRESDGSRQEQEAGL